MSKLVVFTIVAKVDDDFNPHCDVLAVDTKQSGYLTEIEAAEVTAEITGEAEVKWVF